MVGFVCVGWWVSGLVCGYFANNLLTNSSHRQAVFSVQAHANGTRQAIAFRRRDGHDVSIYGCMYIDTMIPVNRQHLLAFSVKITKASDNLPNIKTEPKPVTLRPCISARENGCVGESIGRRMK